jgi:hypothetical protein
MQQRRNNRNSQYDSDTAIKAKVQELALRNQLLTAQLLAAKLELTTRKEIEEEDLDFTQGSSFVANRLKRKHEPSDGKKGSITKRKMKQRKQEQHSTTTSTLPIAPAPVYTVASLLALPSAPPSSPTPAPAPVPVPNPAPIPSLPEPTHM